jgi:hypothetical protein
MRKLIESTIVSLDGVIESPERWSVFDEEAVQLSMQDLDNYDAFVMGRVTYERFRANWSPVSGNPYIDRINAMPKYVASRSLNEGTWNATLLGPDIVGAIGSSKPSRGRTSSSTARVASTTRSCGRASWTRCACGSCPSWSALPNVSSKTSTLPRCALPSPTPARSRTARRSSPASRADGGRTRAR